MKSNDTSTPGPSKAAIGNALKLTGCAFSSASNADRSPLSIQASSAAISVARGQDMPPSVITSRSTP
jgi:hypothetical protein